MLETHPSEEEVKEETTKPDHDMTATDECNACIKFGNSNDIELGGDGIDEGSRSSSDAVDGSLELRSRNTINEKSIANTGQNSVWESQREQQNYAENEAENEKLRTPFLRKRKCCNSESGFLSGKNGKRSATSTKIWLGTLALMNTLAKILLWLSFVATFAGSVWYSFELKKHGADSDHLAWFASGAFVLLGFPISIYGIFKHLANFYQPSIQMYVVRILWMVPVYSIESWLCLRFKQHAIYIETARDCYESFVLYSFFQYLIAILGGERNLVLMLKDKSPTRGVHIWGFNWFIKPWLMGQPLTSCITTLDPQISSVEKNSPRNHKRRRRKQVQWTSPFFVNCKFGVLQYVILKLITAFITMILELAKLYKEGDFSVSSPYLYLSFTTGTSQTWALYCLIFFYKATKTELAPIQPVGKFLSVKSIVFFTWWQSLVISVLVQLNMLPHITGQTSVDVAKTIQSCLICIEMFVAAIVHTFVFPHTDYIGGGRIGGPIDLQLGTSGNNVDHHGHFHRPYRHNPRLMLGRRGHYYHRTNKEDVAGAEFSDHESVVESSTQLQQIEQHHIDAEDDFEEGDITDCGSVATSASTKKQKKNIVQALIHSAVPIDVMDNTVELVKGEYHVEKKTLLHHASTSDEYDIISMNNSKRRRKKIIGNSKNPLYRKVGKITSISSKIRDGDDKSRHVKPKMKLNEFL